MALWMVMGRKGIQLLMLSSFALSPSLLAPPIWGRRHCDIERNGPVQKDIGVTQLVGECTWDKPGNLVRRTG